MLSPDTKWEMHSRVEKLKPLPPFFGQRIRKGRPGESKYQGDQREGRNRESHRVVCEFLGSPQICTSTDPTLNILPKLYKLSYRVDHCPVSLTTGWHTSGTDVDSPTN